MKILFSLLLAIVPLTQAFPTGAGGCGTGESAATPRHGAASGDLRDGGYSVDIDTDVNDITVTLSGEIFRGFLIRMEDVEVDAFDDSIAQIASVCSTPAIGVTHTSRDDKTEASATFSTDGPGTYAVEVTVVESFSSTFYESFSVIIPEPTPEPTAVPETPEPTDAPTLVPATPEPTDVAETPEPTESDETPEPTEVGETPRPTPAPVTPSPVDEIPVVDAPFVTTLSPIVGETIMPTGNLTNFTDFNFTNVTNATDVPEVNVTERVDENSDDDDDDDDDSKEGKRGKKDGKRRARKYRY